MVVGRGIVVPPRQPSILPHKLENRFSAKPEEEAGSPFPNNRSMLFDGTGDYLNISSISTSSYGTSGTDLTISIWAKIDSSQSGNPGPLQHNSAGTSGDRERPLWLSDGRLHEDRGSGTGHNTAGPSDVEYDVWKLWTWTMSSSVYKVYKNGSTVTYTATDTTPHLNDFTAELEICAGDSALFGHAKHLAIWTVALDATNISAIYNSGTPIDLREDSGSYDQSANLIHYYLMEDTISPDPDTTSTVFDRAGSDDLTVQGNPTFTDDVP